MWRASDFGGRIHTSFHRYQVCKISLWVGRPNKLEQPFKESEQSGDYFKKQNLSSVEGGIPRGSTHHGHSSPRVVSGNSSRPSGVLSSLSRVSFCLPFENSRLLKSHRKSEVNQVF
ncbi:hypothetical protein TNIN_471851 [Trichonephila inaurata madagascariensis]|uniref:Uncharacterized protein n=1 Tax=Trichonephila inaurata madagascariensis TaxID=2747483 RepID=A0A8X6JLJ9_9ARAC|nr:hypothetical protein TNIN_471851 [Trichonephila inaurata madagascariensis]